MCGYRGNDGVVPCLRAFHIKLNEKNLMRYTPLLRKTRFGAARFGHRGLGGRERDGADSAWRAGLLEQFPRATDRRTFLSVCRSAVESILKSQIGDQNLDAYLSAYDIGVAKGLYGDDTAVVAGLTSRAVQAAFSFPDASAGSVVQIVTEEGVRHGKLATDTDFF